MADLTLTDPLGRSITLHDHTWNGHILKRHPEMRGRRHHAEAAITSPSALNFSTSDPDCRLYYGQPNPQGIMVVTVADVVSGHVKTAYRTKRVKPGATEWSLPTP